MPLTVTYPSLIQNVSSKNNAVYDDTASKLEVLYPFCVSCLHVLPMPLAACLSEMSSAVTTTATASTNSTGRVGFRATLCRYAESHKSGCTATSYSGSKKLYTHVRIRLL